MKGLFYYMVQTHQTSFHILVQLSNKETKNEQIEFSGI